MCKKTQAVPKLYNMNNLICFITSICVVMQLLWSTDLMLYNYNNFLDSYFGISSHATILNFRAEVLWYKGCIYFFNSLVDKIHNFSRAQSWSSLILYSLMCDYLSILFICMWFLTYYISLCNYSSIINYVILSRMVLIIVQFPRRDYPRFLYVSFKFWLIS